MDLTIPLLSDDGGMSIWSNEIHIAECFPEPVLPTKSYSFPSVFSQWFDPQFSQPPSLFLETQTSSAFVPTLK